MTHSPNYVTESPQVRVYFRGKLVSSSQGDSIFSPATDAAAAQPTPNDRVISLAFDSRDFSEDEQFIRWRDMISNIGVVERRDDTESPFHSRTVSYFTSSALLARYGASHESSLDRTPQIAANYGEDAFAIQLRMSGYEYDTSFDTCELQRPGSLRVIDLERPYFSANESHNVISLVLQKKELFDRAPELSKLHGMFIPDNPMSGLFKSQLISVMDALPNLSQTEAEQTTSILTDMFWACMSSQEQPAILESDSMDKVVLQAVRHCIDQHLHNPDLSPSLIAKIVAVSRSKLFTVCQPFGGPMELVRFKRLRRALELFKTGQSKNVTDTAYAVGFDNRETFSRAFKKEFGYSPKEFMHYYKNALRGSLSPNGIAAKVPEWQLRQTVRDPSNLR